jgi:uncharacterized protein YwqG
LQEQAWVSPIRGLLSFFVFQDDQTGYVPGVVEEVPNDVKVIFTPASHSLVRRLNAPVSNSANPRYPSALMTMRECWDLPSDTDHVRPDLLTAYEEVRRKIGEKELFRFREKMHNLEHHFGGYPIHATAPGACPPAEWVPLLCIHSDSSLEMSWHDGDHLSIQVHQDDIVDKNFRRVIAYAF